MKLTPNFDSSEFTKTPFESLLPVQQYMLKNLAATLQVLRNVLQKSMTITSGMRSQFDYDDLKSRGYNPSNSSDHFFGTPIPLTDPTKIKKYGTYWCYGVGAADVVVKDMSSDVVFGVALNLIKQGKIVVGQCIHEYNSKFNWIHLSNPPSLIYSDYICKTILNKTMLLTSTDAGKTYIPYV